MKALRITVLYWTGLDWISILYGICKRSHQSNNQLGLVGVRISPRARAFSRSEAFLTKHPSFLLNFPAIAIEEFDSTVHSAFFSVPAIFAKLQLTYSEYH